MKKILLTVFFLVAIFSFKLVSAGDVSANTAIEGVLDNRNGSVNAFVTLNCYRSGGTFFQSVNYTIGPGNTTNALCTEDGHNPNYSIDWTTSCDVGAASATHSFGTNYTFVNQDVHCTTPNTSVLVTGTSCTGSTGRVDWSISGTNRNVDYFKVYKSLGASSNPDSDTSPITVDYSSTTTNYGTDITGLSNGTWNVKVNAYANAPDGGNYVYATGSFVCGGNIAPPSNLQANVTCVGLQAKVDFGWVAATGGTFTYVVETSTAASDPGPSGSWPGPSATPNPTNNTFVSTNGTYDLATTYWWHVKATSASPAATYFSNSKTFTTSSNCSDFQPAVLGELTTCLSHNANALYLVWNRGTPVNQIVSEKLEVSTSNSPFGVPISTVNPAVDGITASGMDITSLTDGTTYWIRHKTVYTGGTTNYSEAKPFRAPVGCFVGADSPSMWGIDYCFQGSPRVRLQWSSSSTQINGYRLYRTSIGLPPPYEGSPPLVQSFAPAVKHVELIGLPGDTFHIYKAKNQSGGIISYTAPTNTFTSAPNCTAAPAAPQNLQVSAVTCAGTPTQPQITFSFTDKSTSENRFLVDVSTDPNFTVGSYGTKTIDRTGGDIGGIDLPVSFIWNNASPLDAGGDANPQDGIATNNLIPLDVNNYYWRVRANANTAGDSTIKYPDGSASSTIYASGVPVFAINSSTSSPCRPRHDLSAKVVQGSWRTKPGGCNYTAVPTVSFNGGGGTGASATAILSVGYVWVTGGGSGYSAADPPDVTFSGGDPTSPASGDAIIVGDTFVGVNLTSPGSGYLSAPTISISGGGGGSGAFAIANMTVTSVTIIGAGGSGYTSPPTVSFTGGNGAPWPTASQAGATAEINVSAGAVSKVNLVTPVQTQSFNAETCASMDIQVTNEGGPFGTASPANLFMLYFYYKGGATMPNCPSAGGSIPDDGYTAASYYKQRYIVPSLAPGQSYLAHIYFDMGVTAGAFTGYGYVAPACDSSFAGGTDPDWTNNKSGGFSYKVGVNRFFETTGGDVAADDSISVGVDSSALGPPVYQSEYLVAGTDINLTSTNVRSKNSITLDQYNKSLVAGGGVYKYFTDRLKSKAMINDNGGIGCNIGSGSYTLGNKLYYCSGDVTIDSETQISGNPVFFVNGNLNINNRVFEGGPSDTIVFVVNGDINVATSVVQLDGIYIARKSFSDGGTVAAPEDKLNVSGSIWVDGESGGNMNLTRSFSAAPDNAANPTMVVNYNPKYVMTLNSVLNFSSVGWGEVAP